MGRLTHKVLRVTGGKVAYTNTSRIPDAEIEAAIRHLAKDVNLDRVVIHVKRSVGRSAQGWAYGYIPSVMNRDGLAGHRWRYLITVAAYDSTSMHERVFDTLAHEARHIDQYRSGRIRQVKRERQCEADARAFAGWATERWLEASAA